MTSLPVAEVLAACSAARVLASVRNVDSTPRAEAGMSVGGRPLVLPALTAKSCSSVTSVQLAFATTSDLVTIADVLGCERLSAALAAEAPKLPAPRRASTD